MNLFVSYFDFNKRKIIKKRLLQILVVIILIISFVFAFIPKTKYVFFDKKQIYLVYAKKSMKRSEIEPYSDELKSLGGGAVIFHSGDYFYLIASAYFEKDDANEVSENIKNIFSNSGILELKLKKLSRKKISEIKESVKCNLIFKFFGDFLTEFFNEELSYLSGKISDDDILKVVVKNKMKLENIVDKKDNSDEKILEKTEYFSNLCLIYINHFINNFLISSKKKSLVCELSVKIAILAVELSEKVQ